MNLLIIASKPAIRMPDILQRVLEFIRKEELPAPGSQVLAALSGGSDSVALLLILQELGYAVTAAHCNFGLRAEAGEEEAWVNALCARLVIPLYVRRFSQQDFDQFEGQGIQQAARKLRYAFFEEVLANESIPQCATAHHADDQLETQVMSFFRGNSAQLLHSIPSQRGQFFRPLLCLHKSELTDWLRALGQDWQHDRSNDKDDYTRNLVRNQLFPLLERLNPSFRARFSRQGERYAAQQSWMNTHFERLLPQIVSVTAGESMLDLKACILHLGEQHYIVYVEWWLDQMDFSGTQADEITKLLHSHPGAIVRAGEREVLRDRDSLCVRHFRIEEVMKPLPLDFDMEEGAEFTYGSDRIHLLHIPVPPRFVTDGDAETHWMDWDKLEHPIQIRPWREGDRIAPLGLNGSKLVSDILIDQKRDRFSKSMTWVLEDALGIVLVAGYRIAERVAIDRRSSSCLRLERLPSM